MIPIKLTKVRSSHDNLRTDTVLGGIAAIPVVGDYMAVWAESLDGDPEKVRIISTSLIKNVSVSGSVYEVETQNSAYTVEILNAKEAQPG